MSPTLNSEQQATVVLVLGGWTYACYEIGFAWGFVLTTFLVFLIYGLSDVRKGLDHVAMALAMTNLTLATRPALEGRTRASEGGVEVPSG
jgi:hypothetical protein